MTTRVEQLLGACVAPLQTAEDTLFDMITQRDLEQAEGAQIDQLGKLVGQARGGLSDENYRRYITARIAANRSNGTMEDVIRVATLIINDPTATFVITDEFPAGLNLRIEDITVTEVLAAILAGFLRATVIAGVRLVLTYQITLDADGIFRMAGPSAGLGFGSSSDPSAGGKFAGAKV